MAPIMNFLLSYFCDNNVISMLTLSKICKKKYNFSRLPLRETYINISYKIVFKQEFW